MVLRDLALTILSIIWAGILLLVGARFLALLVDANRDSELIQRLYDYSEFWVQPFFGILGLSNEAVESTGGVMEAASLVALVVYLVLGAIVLGIIRSTTSWGGHYHHA